MVLELIIESYKEKRNTARMEKLSQKNQPQPQPSCDLSCRNDNSKPETSEIKHKALPDMQPLEEDFLYEADLEHDYGISTDDDSENAKSKRR